MKPLNKKDLEKVQGGYWIYSGTSAEDRFSITNAKEGDRFHVVPSFNDDRIKDLISEETWWIYNGKEWVED